MKEKKAIERVIARVCRHVEQEKGRAPEGKALRQIEKRVRSSAELLEKKK